MSPPSNNALLLTPRAAPQWKVVESGVELGCAGADGQRCLLQLEPDPLGGSKS